MLCPKEYDRYVPMTFLCPKGFLVLSGSLTSCIPMLYILCPKAIYVYCPKGFIGIQNAPPASHAGIAFESQWNFILCPTAIFYYMSQCNFFCPNSSFIFEKKLCPNVNMVMSQRFKKMAKSPNRDLSWDITVTLKRKKRTR